MHPVLQKEIKNLKKLAKKKDQPLSFIETHIDEVMFVSNGKKTVCVILKEVHLTIGYRVLEIKNLKILWKHFNY